MRILRYPITHDSNGGVRDPYFNFMYFDGNYGVVQQWHAGAYKRLAVSDLIKTLGETGTRVFVFESALYPKELPSALDAGNHTEGLKSFAKFLQPYATIVADGPGGKTYQIDVERLLKRLHRISAK
jgi:hypothetical protein